MYPPWRAARRAGRLDEPVTDIQYTDSNTSREKTSAREQCGSVGRAGVGCGLRSILSGYSALWKHRTDREKRLPGPRATLSPASALGLSTRGKRRGDRATSGIQYARRGAAPGPPCPLHAGREGRHTVPRSLVLQIYGWRPCGRSGVVPEAVSEEPMRSSMSSS